MSSQVEALKDGRIKKPVVAWVSGTCAKLFKSEVQFGHAGAKSGGQAESAQARAHACYLDCCSRRHLVFNTPAIPCWHACQPRASQGQQI